jgi:hypothetical protein
MRFRKLKIAWSITCGVVCLLLIVLWVRSYRDLTWDELGENEFKVIRGRVIVNDVWIPTTEPRSKLAAESRVFIKSESSAVPAGGTTLSVVPAGRKGYTVQLWLITLVVTSLVIVPWLPWRFSLRTLLIAMTLVAVVLGYLASN